MCAIHRISDSPWFILAKIDEDEVLAPVRLLMILIFGLGLGLVILFGAIILFWWKRLEAGFYRKQYLSERDRRALVEHFGYLTRSAHEIILLADENQRIIEANDRACSEYGYSREELLGLQIRSLRDQRHAEEADALFRYADQENGHVYETWHARKDGTPFPVEASMRVIRAGDGRYYQVIIRNLTERERTEAPGDGKD
jgi:PAS domain S-box-containing protein